MTHYESLGVATDATPEQIKKAYRAKAKATHPDAGGSQSDFEPVARAYKVLSDPERRLLYDATGEDARQPVEIEAQNLLIAGFHACIAADIEIDSVSWVRRWITDASKQLPSETKKLKDRKKKLEAKRKRVTSTGPVNLVHIVIDGELKVVEGELANIAHRSEVAKACLTALKTYSEEPFMPEPARGFGSADFAFSASN